MTSTVKQAQGGTKAERTKNELAECRRKLAELLEGKTLKDFEGAKYIDVVDLLEDVRENFEDAIFAASELDMIFGGNRYSQDFSNWFMQYSELIDDLLDRD